MVIDADELKTIGKRLINLAGNEVHVEKAIKNDRTISREYQFSLKEKLVFEYVKDHPGTTQENVVENVKQYSRVTILKTIADLENEGFIEISKDEHKPKKYHLYVNRKNVLVSLIEDLDHFKESFFNLIDETKGTLKTLNDNISVSKRIQEYNLIEALLMPYKCLINTCIMSDLVLRPKEPLDINILYKKFAIILTEIPEIQIKLYESISTPSRFYREDEIYAKIFESGLQSLTQDNMYNMLDTFEKHNLSKSAEQVLDIVWKMSMPLLHIVINSCYSTFIPAEPES
jgi:DNA-binding MarR family transcriptional regulator